MRKLKIWNGSGAGKYMRGHFYIAAYSEKHAAELAGKASGFNNFGVYTIRTYYNAGCWGNPMEGIEPTEPCVYATLEYNDKPVRVI